MNFFCKSFTMIELLVVIAIIVLLAAMLLPALNTAKDRVKIISCAGNMRQMNFALQAYSSDNQGYFPEVNYDTISFFKEKDKVRSYLGNPIISICPACDPNLLKKQFSDAGGTTYRILSAFGSGTDPAMWYGLYPNCHRWPQTSYPDDYGTCIPKIDFAGSGNADSPSKQPVLIDGYDPEDGTWVSYNAYWYSSPKTTPQQNNHFYSKGQNVTFLDGHVDWQKRNNLIARIKVYAEWIYWE